MIIANKLNLSFGNQTIFNQVSFNISQDERIALIGRNGSGKSTLLKVIAKQHLIDSGDCAIENNKKIAYVPQDITLSSNKTIFDEAFSIFEDIVLIEKEIAYLEQDLSCGEKIDKYHNALEEHKELNPKECKIKTTQVLEGLGFKNLDIVVNTLSVGWKMRLVLAKLLLQDADFYLFDEPTNHLDIFAKDWFLEFLKSKRFGFLLVCHDKYFLDKLCNKFFELDQGRLFTYRGSFDSYKEQRGKRKADTQKAFEEQQKEISRKRKTIERFRASATKSKMAQSMLKSLKKMDVIEVESEQKTTNFNFGLVERSGRIVIKLENVAHSFENKKIFKNINLEIERGEKVALIAPNGYGKTTLFNLISQKYNLQEGHIELGYNVFPAIFEQDQNQCLNANNSIYEEVESSCKNEAKPLVRGFLGAFLFEGDTVDKKIGVLSGGEKNKVAMVKVLLQKANFLILDEPTNHLDIESKEILYKALLQFNGTIFFVSHDHEFLNKLSSRIIELTPNKALSYPGNYKDYLYQKQQVNNITKEKKASNSNKNEKHNSNNDFLLKKKIRNLEKKIEILEKDIEKLQIKIASTKYNSEEYKKYNEKIKKQEKTLKEAIQTWENHY